MFILFHLNHDNNKLCLVSAGGDTNIYVLDVSSNNKNNNSLKCMLKGNTNMIRAMEIIHTTTTTHNNPTIMLITSSDDCKIKLWNMHNFTLIKSINDFVKDCIVLCSLCVCNYNSGSIENKKSSDNNDADEEGNVITSHLAAGSQDGCIMLRCLGSNKSESNCSCDLKYFKDFFSFASCL